MRLRGVVAHELLVAAERTRRRPLLPSVRIMTRTLPVPWATCCCIWRDLKNSGAAQLRSKARLRSSRDCIVLARWCHYSRGVRRLVDCVVIVRASNLAFGCVRTAMIRISRSHRVQTPRNIWARIRAAFLLDKRHRSGALKYSAMTLSILARECCASPGRLRLVICCASRVSINGLPGGTHTSSPDDARTSASTSSPGIGCTRPSEPHHGADRLAARVVSSVEVMTLAGQTSSPQAGLAMRTKLLASSVSWS